MLAGHAVNLDWLCFWQMRYPAIRKLSRNALPHARSRRGVDGGEELLLPGGTNQFPGGYTPAVDHRLSTAHPISRLTGPVENSS